MSDARYSLKFYDKNGKKFFQSRVHWVKASEKNEVVPDDDYREVWFDPLYSGPQDDRFFLRAIVEDSSGYKMSSFYAISSEDFENMEMSVYDE